MRRVNVNDTYTSNVSTHSFCRTDNVCAYRLMLQNLGEPQSARIPRRTYEREREGGGSEASKLIHPKILHTNQQVRCDERKSMVKISIQVEERRCVSGKTGKTPNLGRAP